MRNLFLGVLLMLVGATGAYATDMAEVLLFQVSASRVHQYAPNKTYFIYDEGGSHQTEVDKYRTVLGAGLRYYDRNSVGMQVSFRFIKFELPDYGWDKVSESVINSSVYLVMSPVPPELKKNELLVYPTLGVGIGTLQSTFDSCIKPAIMAEIGLSWKRVALSIGTEYHLGKMILVYPGRKLDSFFMSDNIRQWDPIEIEMTVMYYLNLSLAMPLKS